MPISLSGSLNLSGSLTTTGTITATTLVVQTITSSISSITGSTNFGTLSSNTHTFTGSINASGSANFSSSITATGTINAIGTSPLFRNTDNSVGNVFDVLWSVGGSYWAYGVAGFYDATNSQKYDEYKGGASGFRKLYTNGTLALTIASTGATTITATSAVALTANGGNSSDGTVAKFARGGSEKNFYVSATNNQYINLATEGDIRLRTGCTVDQPYATGITALFVSASGNVGIGTSSPSSVLNVVGQSDTVGGEGITLGNSTGNRKWLTRFGTNTDLSYNLDFWDGSTWNNRFKLSYTGAATFASSLATTSFIENRTSFTLLSASDTTIALLYSGIVIIRDANNGGTCVVMYENGATPTIISQQGVTVFTTASPSASQIQLKNRTGDSGIAARAGTSLNGVGIIVCNLRIQGP